MGVGSKAAAILWELAPGSSGHFAGFLQGFQGFLQILQFPSQVLRPQLLTGGLPLVENYENYLIIIFANTRFDSLGKNALEAARNNFC